MPGKSLPSFSPADVKTHNTAKSCYVTLGPKVYDVTHFIDDHPGGADLILKHAGTDLLEIMRDEISHKHTEAAYEILEEYRIGFLDSSMPLCKAAETTSIDSQVESRPVYSSTGMSNESDLSVETDIAADYCAHKFLDLSRPLFPQIWFGGFTKEFYLHQVHRPRHYKGGESAPLFGNFLEPLSKTAWYVVPMVWLPPVIYGTITAGSSFNNVLFGAGYWILGVCIWTLVEYGLHRFLFHIDKYGILILFPLLSLRLLIALGSFRIIGLVSHCTSSCMASIITFPWTSTDLLCPQRYS
jgi:4-hydroxysphinganine ceramide fatty acyl 2-hydroxylase